MDNFSKSMLSLITPGALFIKSHEKFQSDNYDSPLTINEIFFGLLHMILVVVILYYAIILTYNTLPTLPLILAIIFPIPTILVRLIVCHKTVETVANIIAVKPPTPPS